MKVSPDGKGIVPTSLCCPNHLRLSAGGEPRSVGWVEYKELYSPHSPPQLPSPRLNILNPNKHTHGCVAEWVLDGINNNIFHIWKSMIVSCDNERYYSFLSLYVDAQLLCVCLYFCMLFLRHYSNYVTILRGKISWILIAHLSFTSNTA